MNVYLVSIKRKSWCQDYAMVVIAEDEKYAERKARWSSDDFRKATDVVVQKINLDQEQVVLIANTGA
ncbi:hypothetical protein DWX00_12560 [Blautia sp. AF17-9LB]|uniref:hypothetical protein n=1 Tax=Blautia sp. AF17-9LB TaxID=2292959 RepID=UPI000E48FDA2|nr:hypothetical protein [Blautia sp. AF17-9LB]RHR48601.1 hypothetical protein DWX00_12560 [Blautia sp. AF17-9LB]